MFRLLHRNVSLKREREAYQQFTCDQMAELKKLQVFDCWKRLKQVNAIRLARAEQSIELLAKRKMARVMAQWKIASVNE